MGLTYGFYNSVNGDRIYDAIDMSKVFNGIIRDGVFMSIGDCMFVKADVGMQVKVSEGRAWFNGTWTLIEDEPLTVALDAAESVLTRIDAIVLEVDQELSARENSIKVVKGTPARVAVNPTLTNNENVHQYPLAYITITPGLAKIKQEHITNSVGTSATPFVTGILDRINIDDLIAQWEDEWSTLLTSKIEDYNQWVSNITTEYQTWTTTQKAAYETWISGMQNAFVSWKNNYESEFETWDSNYKNDFLRWKSDAQAEYETWEDTHQETYNAWFLQWKTNFNTWFETLQDVLDGDVAGHLQNEIESLNKLYKNIVVEPSNFVADTTYRGYEYRADISIPEATADYFPMVVFSYADVRTGNYSCISETGPGYVRIFANAVPESSITIPSITLMKGVN